MLCGHATCLVGEESMAMASDDIDFVEFEKLKNKFVENSAPRKPKLFLNSLSTINKSSVVSR